MTKYGKAYPENKFVKVAKPRPGIAIGVAKGNDYGTLGAIVNGGFLTNYHVVAAAMGDVYCPPSFGGKNKAAEVIGKVSDANVDKALDAVIVTFAIPASGFSLEVEYITDADRCVKLKHTKIIAPKEGMWVWKMGATTGFTIGYVSRVSGDAINVTHAPTDKVDEWKGLVRDAGFSVAEVPSPPPLCDVGDSGSVWAQVGTNAAVGLHRKSSSSGDGTKLATAARMDAIKKKWGCDIKTS